VLGAVAERVLIRPVENRAPLDAVIVTFGLLVLLQGIAGMFFGGTPRSYPPAFGIVGYKVGGRRLLFAPNDLWIVLVVVAVMVILAVVFRWTSLGLRMRAAAFAPEVSRLLGVRVGHMLTIGWALAAAFGALAGVLIAPSTFVSPTAFDAALVFGFTAAVIGGLDSPPGALVGGISLGITLSYVSGYIGSDVVSLGALVAVLMVRPRGLFGAVAGRRV
jgi:branched-chain amino acid transport system permease protein